MISVYLPNETNFKDNGLKILKPLKAIIRKEDNKDFYISLKDTIENKEYYSSGNIIRTNTPWGKQNFRISGINVRKKYIEIKNLYQ